MQLFKASPPPLGLTVEPTEQAIATRDELVLSASAITGPPTTVEENDRIGVYGQAMQTLIKTTEEDGLGLRRPYNAEADKIKKVQDAYLDPLRPLLKKLGGFSAAWRTEQERKAEDDRKARAAEIVRLDDEKRKADEAVRLANEKGDLMGSLNADIQASALAAATVAAIATPVPEAAKTKGQSFKAQDLDWELVDIGELWRNRPDLCNPPTPKASAIKSTCSPERPVPGLRLWWKASVNFKANR